MKLGDFLKTIETLQIETLEQLAEQLKKYNVHFENKANRFTNETGFVCLFDGMITNLTVYDGGVVNTHYLVRGNVPLLLREQIDIFQTKKEEIQETISLYESFLEKCKLINEEKSGKD